MMGLYRRSDSPYWWSKYTDASEKVVYRSTRTKDRKEADALNAKWRLEAYEERQWGREPDHSFDEMMARYKDAMSGELRSPERFDDAMLRLRPQFGGRMLGSLKRADVSEYIEKRKRDGVGPYTINRELDVLSAAINYSVRKWDWTVRNVVSGMSLREPEGRLRFLTRAEATRLIAECDVERKSPHLGDFVRLALNTGCRRGELLGLTWDRVDLKQNLIRLESRHTKTRKPRVVPLNLEARQAVLGRARFRAERCPDARYVFCHANGKAVKQVFYGFKAACERAGVTDFRVHDLRHTCASWLVQEGVPLYDVSKLLGHSSIEMTQRYAHLAAENERKAVAVLDRLRSSDASGASVEKAVA